MPLRGHSGVYLGMPLPARRGYICGGMHASSYLMRIWMHPSPFLVHHMHMRSDARIIPSYPH